MLSVGICQPYGCNTRPSDPILSQSADRQQHGRCRAKSAVKRWRPVVTVARIGVKGDRLGGRPPGCHIGESGSSLPGPEMRLETGKALVCPSLSSCSFPAESARIRSDQIGVTWFNSGTSFLFLSCFSSPVQRRGGRQRQARSLVFAARVPVLCLLLTHDKYTLDSNA
jgi:hypothetical protein